MSTSSIRDGAVRAAVGLIASVLAAGVFVVSSAANAQSITGLSSAEIERILTDAGLDAEVGEDADTGAPVARAQLGDILFWVRGLDCGDGGCTTLIFFANFELGRSATSNDLVVVNRFNERQVFGRAYLIEDRSEVGVDYVIELDGGVSAENVASNVSIWTDVVTAFIEHFQAADETAGS